MITFALYKGPDFMIDDLLIAILSELIVIFLLTVVVPLLPF